MREEEEQLEEVCGKGWTQGGREIENCLIAIDGKFCRETNGQIHDYVYINLLINNHFFVNSESFNEQPVSAGAAQREGEAAAGA